MAAHARLPTVGDTFGRYHIDAQIGRGGMGVVYGATDTAVGRTVALKVVAAGLGDNEEFRLRFEREAAVLARLDSPHVIDIYDYGTQDGCPYIATQYVGGGDLGALLADRGPMPPTLALRVCAQIADALHDAHRVGVVHRDVKPTNVLLRERSGPEEDLYAYLCDFGIARTATDGLTAPGSVAGTWSYLAPECGRGGAATPASDVYALGCLLWAALTGRPPYVGTDVEIAVSHQRAPLPRLEGTDELSARINDVLARSMAKQPQDRYPDADALRLDLEAAAVLRDSGIRPAPTPSVSLGGGMGAPGSSPGATPSGQSPAISFGSMPPHPSPVPGYAAAGAPSRGRARLVAALVSLAVVAVIGTVVWLTARGGGPSADPGAAGSSAPTTPTTTATDGSPTDSPTGSSSGPAARVDQGGPITGDRDGDGLGEVVVRYDRYRAPNDTRGGALSDLTTFTSDGTTLTPGESVDRPDLVDGYPPLLGDFDGDDRLEELTLTRGADAGAVDVSGTLSGGGELTGTLTARATPEAFAATDLDGDGSDDVVSVGFDSANTTAQLDAARVQDGTLAETAPLADAPAPLGDSVLTAGDLDGDGLGDVVTMVRQGDTASDRFRVTVHLGDGDGGAAAGPQTTLTGLYGPTLLAGDLDGDEDAELVVVDRSEATITVLDLVDGALGDPVQAGQFPGQAKQLGTGIVDVDGDGRDDVVAVASVKRDKAVVSVALSAGTASFSVSQWGTWDKELNKYGFEYGLTVEGGAF